MAHIQERGWRVENRLGTHRGGDKYRDVGKCHGSYGESKVQHLRRDGALSEVISVFAIDSGQTTGNPKSYPTETRVSPRASDFRDGICLESLRADMGGTP